MTNESLSPSEPRLGTGAITVNSADMPHVPAAEPRRDEREAAWQKFLDEEITICIGYPDCDGDLEATPHSEKCPAFKGEKRPSPKQIFDAGWAARASAATAEKFTDREEAVIADLMESEEMSRTGILRQGLRMYQGVRKGAAKFEWLPVGSLKADVASQPQPSQPSDWIVACEEFRPENHELGGSYKVTMHSGKVWHTTEKPPSAGQTEGK